MDKGEAVDIDAEGEVLKVGTEPGVSHIPVVFALEGPLVGIAAVNGILVVSAKDFHVLQP